MGDPESGSSVVDQNQANAQLLGDLYAIFGSPKAVVARVAQEYARQYANRLVMQAPDPIVKPRVRVLAQFDPPWSAWYVRAPGQRNSFKDGTEGTAAQNPRTPETATTGNDNWKDNGCFPTCLAMIVRWWAEDYPETAGKLQFPFSGAESQLNPVELCRRLFGKPYAPCMQIAVKEDDQEDRRKRGFNDPTKEWIMNQAALLAGFESITREARPFEGLSRLPGTQRFYLRHKRFNISQIAKVEDRRTTLKSALQYGPAIVCMQYPGHCVVIDAYRGHEISVCDPGAVLVNGGDWKTPPDSRPADQLPGGTTDSADSRRRYVQVNDEKKFKTASGKFDDLWLKQITSLDQFYTSDNDVHPEWSNLEVTK